MTRNHSIFTEEINFFVSCEFEQGETMLAYTQNLDPLHLLQTLRILGNTACLKNCVAFRNILSHQLCFSIYDTAKYQCECHLRITLSRAELQWQNITQNT